MYITSARIMLASDPVRPSVMSVSTLRSLRFKVAVCGRPLRGRPPCPCCHLWSVCRKLQRRREVERTSLQWNCSPTCWRNGTLFTTVLSLSTMDRCWFACIGRVFQMSGNRYSYQKYKLLSRYADKTCINRRCFVKPLQIQKLKDSLWYMNRAR
jgi:hypothetical protein